MFRPVLAATLAALTLSVSSLSAQTVFDNGTPNYSGGAGIYGGITHANDFVLGAATSLSAFNWWAMVDGVNGPATIQADYLVSVFTNNSGLPDISLFSQTYLSQTGTRDESICCGLETAYTGYTFSADLGGLTLGAGTYWIAIGGFPSFTLWLATGTAGQQNFRGVQGAESTWFQNIDEGAFNLTGTPATVVPEPASLALVASGLLGLAAIARRRRGSLRE